MMDPQENYKRHIVVAIDLSDQSFKALLWTANDFYRPGDCVHLVHVNRCLQPQMTIQHNFPGATYDIPQLNELDEVQHTEQVKEVIKSRFSSVLDDLKIPHVLHMFLDTDNAPASAVCAVVFRIAKEAAAVLIVLAAHNKAYGWNDMLLGSVADYCTQYSTVPLMVIRDYKIAGVHKKPSFPGGGPLVIPWASSSPRSSPQASPLAREKLKALGMPQGANDDATMQDVSPTKRHQHQD